jgi:hypothetical protein
MPIWLQLPIILITKPFIQLHLFELKQKKRQGVNTLVVVNGGVKLCIYQRHPVVRKNYEKKKKSEKEKEKKETRIEK